MYFRRSVSKKCPKRVYTCLNMSKTKDVSIFASKAFTFLVQHVMEFRRCNFSSRSRKTIQFLDAASCLPGWLRICFQTWRLWGPLFSSKILYMFFRCIYIYIETDRERETFFFTYFGYVSIRIFLVCLT